MECDSIMYCIHEVEANLLINFILIVFLSNGYNIPFILIFRLSSTMGRCYCGTMHC